MAEADLGSSLELQNLLPHPVLEFQSTRHEVTTAQVHLFSKPEETDRHHTLVSVSEAIAALSPNFQQVHILRSLSRLLPIPRGLRGEFWAPWLIRIQCRGQDGGGASMLLLLVSQPLEPLAERDSR